MKNKISLCLRLFAATLAALLLLCGCNLSGRTPGETLVPINLQDAGSNVKNLTAKSDAVRQSATPLRQSDIKAAADFALKLLAETEAYDATENKLISPLSVMIALSMTANGAAGDTLTEMEKVLGMSVPELNTFLNSYAQSLSSTDKAKMVTANSVWISNDRGLSVNQAFVDEIVKYYEAAIVSAPFNDTKTTDEMNKWVSDNTDKMIDKIIEKLDESAIMVLLNAITFDALWKDQFDHPAYDSDFTNADGSVCKAQMMSGEATKYISGKECTGFKKDYADGAYSYVALLPASGVKLDDFISSLDGESFLSLVNSAEKKNVQIYMPKYSFDYEIEMVEILKTLGMPVAFDGVAADFSALGQCAGGNIYIGDVIHKTHIEVDESGTRAAAVTAVIMDCKSAVIYPQTVKLDRPFVYAIVDNATGLPVFIGAVDNLT